MELINFSLISLLVIFIFMNLFFLASVILKRNDIADSAWGIGFIVIAMFNLFISKDLQQTKIILTFLVFLWGLRLAGYITLRNWGKTEDFRYKEWKEKWGKKALLKSYLQVFLLQGFFMFLVSLPATLYNRFDGGVAIYSFIGLLIWVLGFYFETVGDLQMYFFKKEPHNKGKIMDQGLWQYTRHPNYFGEVTMWWGIWILTLGSTYWYLGIIGPITISFLILKVSGIPLLEKKYKGNKDFEIYKKKTSAFFPWFNKG
jgi:steroid 5-alpha reductase family enzyme